jgi:hypothetical protein
MDGAAITNPHSMAISINDPLLSDDLRPAKPVGAEARIISTT